MPHANVHEHDQGTSAAAQPGVDGMTIRLSHDMCNAVNASYGASTNHKCSQRLMLRRILAFATSLNLAGRKMPDPEFLALVLTLGDCVLDRGKVEYEFNTAKSKCSQQPRA